MFRQHVNVVCVVGKASSLGTRGNGNEDKGTRVVSFRLSSFSFLVLWGRTLVLSLNSATEESRRNTLQCFSGNEMVKI